jgi:hypothetical protein
VGGGTASLTMATSLEPDGRLTVGVVEAGSLFTQESGNHSLPLGYNYHGFGGSLGPFDPISDWGFRTKLTESTAKESVFRSSGRPVGSVCAHLGFS